MSIADSLKDLAAKHSYMKVHTELLSLMKEEYAALKGFFEVDSPRKKRSTVASGKIDVAPSELQPPVTTSVEEEIPAKVLANTKIRIIKKAASPDASFQEGPKPQQQKVLMDSKELKAWQKEQEAKKLAELTAAGTNPESLLTPESIKRWVEDEGRTFAYVAREYVGLPEATVADFAKAHGVKSKISKTRAILSAKNRRPV